MERFSVYLIPDTGIRSFSRGDLSWTLEGTVLAPVGSVLFPAVRSGKLMLRVPDSADHDGRPYIFPAGEAMHEATKGGCGLRWEPAPGPDLVEGEVMMPEGAGVADAS